MEDAQQTKAPIAKIVDQVAGVFVPVVMGIALLSGLFWYFIMGETFTFAMTVTISVLVIACPCARLGDSDSHYGGHRLRGRAWNPLQERGCP